MLIEKGLHSKLMKSSIMQWNQMSSEWLSPMTNSPTRLSEPATKVIVKVISTKPKQQEFRAVSANS